MQESTQAPPRVAAVKVKVAKVSKESHHHLRDKEGIQNVKPINDASIAHLNPQTANPDIRDVDVALLNPRNGSQGNKKGGHTREATHLGDSQGEEIDN